MKWILPIFFVLMLMPMVAAETCSLTNLADCLPEKFFDYILEIVNAPLEWLLELIQTLLSNDVEIEVFEELWAISVYIISMFYGLLFMYSGFNFMISGYDSAKREQAKSWLRNVLIMIVLVQASYLIYILILDLNSALTTSVFNLIDSDFFVFTADSFSQVANELMFGLAYLLVIFITIIVLGIRYLVVSFGLALFPIAIFCYFIMPLRGFGKAIFNFLMINIFMSFFASLIFLVGSMLLETTVFADTKMLVMIVTFLVVDLIMLYFMFFGLIMSAVGLFFKVKTFGLINAFAQKLTPAKTQNTVTNQKKIPEYN
jgi:hypothetical protein